MMENRNEQLVFVYGWQLDTELLAQYCPGARVVATGRLAGYDLGFFGHTPKWEGAEEALVAKSGSEVWGRVLALSAAGAERMDGMLNVHGDGSGSYFHYPADVEGSDGQRYETLTYMKTALREPRTPSDEYKQRLIAGALAHGLPLAYIARLRAVAAHALRAQWPQSAINVRAPAGRQRAQMQRLREGVPT